MEPSGTMATARKCGQLAPLLALSLMLAWPASAMGPGAGQAVECDGQPATIVGTPDMAVLRGTPGADVIVTGGATTVRARGGDDIVCVTGATGLVVAGTGEDKVDTSEAIGSSTTTLGDGDDVFAGGAHADAVDGGAGGDQVATGAGADTWVHGTGDTADLGAGTDRATVSEPVPAGALDGGPGPNALNLTCCDNQAWVVDNVAEVAAIDGVTRFEWQNFRSFEVSADRGTLEFLGSDAGEKLIVSHFFEFGVGLERAAMGAGDDQVLLSHACCRGSVDGGPGNDWLRALNNGDERSPGLADLVVIDLAAGFMATPSQELVGVENVEVEDFTRSVLRGNSQPNRFVVGTGCLVRVQGGGGADTLRTGSRSRCPAWSDTPAAVKANGGLGRDSLWGRDSKDRLIGGRGHDSVDGKRARDVCRAEVVLRCERRR